MTHKSKHFSLSLGFVFFFIALKLTWAGQTGKITGKVVDADTGEPLPAANIVVQGTTMGAASDLQGDFVILNIPPGTYNLVASMMGYQSVQVSNVKVSVDRTTRVDFKLNPTVLETETVVVVAEQPLIQRDLTATASSVSSEEIEAMPVENLKDILQLQAGIVVDSQGDLHIRGGRTSEIAYLVDGVSVSDPFSGKSAVDVNQTAIQELKVISGTFNAEYGQVMSGIVEVVTKDPGSRFSMGGTFYVGDYVSSHDEVFFNIGALAPLATYNAQFHITGPMPFLSDRLSYFLSVRKIYNEGWLYGERRFLPSDSSNFQNPNALYMEQSGDAKPVPMNDNDQYYVNAKLVLRLSPMIKIKYSLLGDFRDFRNYNHLFRLNPEGDVRNHQYGITHILNWNHAVSANTFYTVKLSRYYFDFESYLYEDRHDPRYVNPRLMINREDAFSFLTGGTNMTHFYRSTTVDVAKFDITSQVTKVHQIKTGLEFKHNRIHVNSRQAFFNGLEGGGVFNPEDFFRRGEYTHKPVEFAAYLQDKIELQNMTLNLGLRYDYFNSNGDIPTDLRDPGGIYRPSPSAYKDAESKHQLSPRIGIAFPLSDRGVVHTSYGHFFQIPPYEFLYLNPRFAVAPGGLNTLMGNANLNPQSTVIYEVGFQQELFGQMGVDITGFYKDVRDLLGTNIYETYALGDRYARYENRDYGNIRGITLTVNKRPTSNDHLTVSFDYTFQVAEGNASDPNHEFYNQQSDPPKQSNIQVVPLDWDQRHTVNLSLSYHNPKLFSMGLIGRFQTGLPYTPAIQNIESTFENSARRPFLHNVDLRLSREFRVQGLRYTLFVKVFNLFDQLNEIDVYQDTGRAGYSLVSHYIGERRAHVNTLEEWLLRPDFYSEPRQILAGFEIQF